MPINFTQNNRPEFPNSRETHFHHAQTTMDFNSFMLLKNMISDASFDSRKLEIAKFAVSRNYLSSSQILELTNLFSFESNKLDFAKFAYQYASDPGSYFIVANAFSFNSNKRALFDFIGF